MSGEVQEILKFIGDIIAASVTVLTVLKVLPAIASVLAIAYYGMVYYQLITGKQFSETRLAKFLSGRSSTKSE